MEKKINMLELQMKQLLNAQVHSVEDAKETIVTNHGDNSHVKRKESHILPKTVIPAENKSNNVNATYAWETLWRCCNIVQ